MPRAHGTPRGGAFDDKAGQTTPNTPAQGDGSSSTPAFPLLLHSSRTLLGLCHELCRPSTMEFTI